MSPLSDSWSFMSEFFVRLFCPISCTILVRFFVRFLVRFGVRFLVHFLDFLGPISCPTHVQFFCPISCFFQASGIWKSRVSVVEVYERVWKSVISLKDQKANRRISEMWKRPENVVGRNFIHNKKTVNLRQLQGMKICRLGIWKGYNLSIECIRKRVPSC